MEKLTKLTQREFNTNETFQLFKASGSIFWSWGVSKIINYGNKGLLLKVQGHHHRGWVFIVLAWNDTYTVHYLSSQYNVKDTHEDIYFDMLVDIIDKRIEFVEDYK